LVKRTRHNAVNLVQGHLSRLELAQTTNGRADSGGGSSAEDVSTASNGLGARLALPDTSSLALHAVLAAEHASVLGVLGDLDLLDLLTQRGTIASTVLADNTDLLRSLSHFSELCLRNQPNDVLTVRDIKR